MEWAMSNHSRPLGKTLDAPKVGASTRLDDRETGRQGGRRVQGEVADAVDFKTGQIAARRQRDGEAEAGTHRHAPPAP